MTRIVMGTLFMEKMTVRMHMTNLRFAKVQKKTSSSTKIINYFALQNLCCFSRLNLLIFTQCFDFLLSFFFCRIMMKQMTGTKIVMAMTTVVTTLVMTTTQVTMRSPKVFYLRKERAVPMTQLLVVDRKLCSRFVHQSTNTGTFVEMIVFFCFDYTPTFILESISQSFLLLFLLHSSHIDSTV